LCHFVASVFKFRRGEFELGRKVVEMGRLAKQQIEDATGAMLRRDVAFAERVAAADRRLDALQREIEGLAVTTIARRQQSALRP
jgi:phosphate transport system protein